MADETDVENTLVGLIAGYLYPNGTSQASAASPVPPKGIQIFRGWPSTQAQEAAKGTLLSNGTYTNQFVNVSVAARNGVERDTTRHTMDYVTVVAPVNTVTVSVNNNVVTFGGTVPSNVTTTPQNVIILVGQDNVFNYAVQATDTLASIAAALSSLIVGKFPGTSATGTVLTIKSGRTILARIIGLGSVLQEVGRQSKSFQVTVWAPPSAVIGQDPDAWRTAVIKVIEPKLRSLNRIVLPDQTYAQIHYERTITMDLAQNDGLYRRDLFLTIDYASTITSTAYEIGVFQDQFTPAGPGLDLPPTSDDPTTITNS